jgi:hypothetical protein
MALRFVACSFIIALGIGLSACSTASSASGHITGAISACEAANDRANGPPRFTTVPPKPLTAKMASLIAHACTPAQLTSDASKVLYLPLATHRTEVEGIVSRIESEICPANPGSKLCPLPGPSTP